MTAPDFQPFERRFAKKKKIEKAKFLLSEEGHDDFVILDETATSDNNRSFDGMGLKPVCIPNPNAIYIDEVMQRANEYVASFADIVY